MAASVGTLICRGQSGQAYILDLLSVDAAADYDHFSTGGVGASAATPEEWVPPENITIEHYVQVAATTAVRRQFIVNGTATGNIMRCSIHTPSATNLGTGPYLGLKIAKGSKLAIGTLA